MFRARVQQPRLGRPRSLLHGLRPLWRGASAQPAGHASVAEARRPLGLHLVRV